MIFAPLTKTRKARELAEYAFNKAILNINPKYEIKNYNSITQLRLDINNKALVTTDFIVLMNMNTIAEIQLLHQMKAIMIEVFHLNMEPNTLASMLTGGFPPELIETDIAGDILTWKKLSGVSDPFNGSTVFFTKGNQVVDEMYAEDAVNKVLATAPKNWFGIPTKQRLEAPEILAMDIMADPTAVYGKMTKNKR